MNHSGQTVHPVREDEQSIAYYIIAEDDTAHLIGDFGQTQRLYEKLALLVEQGIHDGFLDADDPRIATWLTVREAAKLSGLSVWVIQWACRHGDIDGVLSDPWRFTLHAFRRWRHNRRKLGRKHNPLTQAQLGEIVQLHRAGKSATAIALTMVGYSNSRIIARVRAVIAEHENDS